ncbi:SAM-dependent methyltransferase [Kibdelosporangium banguiense]|uniref:SAM-dependent methyltransferase n=1 Tax=Kibdelosporangium banguiense TaxID=1365924 RepID=A0ABS4TTM3_9PSEU|nr:SAM-dependent methyltransferase [Kibdelosporangium banguiense]MBP2327750.1 SAM-dependent methyltransferase [Kibdelosporangium banguiense]
MPTSVDLQKPSAARIYDYLLGGNHNFAVDREFIAKILQIQPEAKRFAVMNRAFLRRSVLFMVQQGIRQFLDLGSGIPTVGNVHEIAQGADPASRVVYVDNEHVAVEHSQLLLNENDNAVMVHADITRPGLVLGDPAMRLLDFSQPIGLLAITIGHYVLDKDDPAGVFAAYREVLAPGSYLALTHLTDDFKQVKGDELTEMMKKSQNNVQARTKSVVTGFFGDFELVEPGLVTTSQWRPEQHASPGDNPEADGLYAGVARKK